MSKPMLELLNCTNVLLDEIADRQIPRDSIAKTYAMAIMSSEPPDWKRVNAAIIERWSHAGLNYIKVQAWRIVENPKRI